MSKKLVVSQCCEASVEPYPLLSGFVFFCSKCDKECKTKIKKEKVKKE
jgi:hypothetical protein